MTALEGGWRPDWATHPGEHLEEHLEALGLSQAEFARLADLSPKLVSTIISGKNPVTPETALKLERVLDMKASVWTALQANWDLHEARLRAQERAREDESWLRRFPLNELKRRGVLPNTKDHGALMEALLGFLRVGGPGGFDARYAGFAVQHRQARSRAATSKEHILSWLLLGEAKAARMGLPAYDRKRFEAALHEIRELTVADRTVFEPQMTTLCHHAGVALVFEKPIPKTCLYGSARWIDEDHAILQMSLRMKTNDHFWWTFFHEAGHILLHKGRNFVDDSEAGGDGPESEADAFAADMLVGEDFETFAATRPSTRRQIERFAEEIGLHPGIIVGMLQHRKIIPYSHCNDLKARFEWKQDPTS